jgi:FG-GAP repeat
MKMKRWLVIPLAAIALYLTSGPAFGLSACVTLDKICDRFELTYDSGLGIWSGNSDGCIGQGSYPTYLKVLPTGWFMYLDFSDQGWPPDCSLGDYAAVQGSGVSGNLTAWMTCQQLGPIPVQLSLCPEPYTEEVEKLVSFDIEDEDYFGRAVSISGDYAIVGSPWEDSRGLEAGAAYVFRRVSGNTWVAGTKLMAPDAQGNDRFGSSVAINGDYAIIGAPDEDTGGSEAGAAYIFHRRSGNIWDRGTKIVASDAQSEDRFGLNLDLDGDYAVIGACNEDALGLDAGAAYVFHRTGVNTWDSGTKITAYDAQSEDWFGLSVAINGNYAVVGAPLEGTNGWYSGATYIFYRTGLNTWDGGTKIMAFDGDFSENFGMAVATDGDYVVVGAPYESIGSYVTGAAYMFHRTGTNTWDGGTKILPHDPGNRQLFGSSLSIRGDYVLFGAPQDYSGGTLAGSAYIFRRTGLNSWEEDAEIWPSDLADGDSFGYAVSISEEYAIIGSPSEDSSGHNAGAAYIYH